MFEVNKANNTNKVTVCSNLVKADILSFSHSGVNTKVKQLAQCCNIIHSPNISFSSHGMEKHKTTAQSSPTYNSQKCYTIDCTMLYAQSCQQTKLSNYSNIEKVLQVRNAPKYPQQRNFYYLK